MAGTATDCSVFSVATGALSLIGLVSGERGIGLDDVAANGAIAATGVPVLCEFGRMPVIAATPIRLTRTTDTAAAAMSGWIRLFDGVVSMICSQ